MIGIICAIEEEFRVIRERILKDPKVERFQIIGRVFYKCDNVVYTMSQIGKCAAAATVAVLISNFGCNKILFIGTAGALTEKAQIGDVCIATSSVQHDFDHRPFHDIAVIPILGLKYLPTSKNLTKIAEDAVKEFQAHDDQKFNVFEGVLCTGDQFVDTEEKRAKIFASVENPIAVAMEGAAASQICIESNVDFSLVRIFSDGSNSNSQMSFIEFCEKRAGKMIDGITQYFVEILKKQ